MLTNEYFKSQFEELYKPYKKFKEYIIPRNIVERLVYLYEFFDSHFKKTHMHLYSNEEVLMNTINYNLKLNQDFAEDIYRLYKAYHNIKLERMSRRNELDMNKLYTTNLNIFEKMKKASISR